MTKTKTNHRLKRDHAKGVDKSFSERFNTIWNAQFVNYFYEEGREEVKQFCLDEIANEVDKALDRAKKSKAPMGIDEWRRHGIKYGYYKYFAKQILDEVKLEREDALVIGGDGIETDLITVYEKGYYQAVSDLEAIKKKLKKKYDNNNTKNNSKN